MQTLSCTTPANRESGRNRSRIAVARGANSEYAWWLFNRFYNLNPSTYTQVDQDFPETFDNVLKGEIDAAVLWDPLSGARGAVSVNLKRLSQWSVAGCLAGLVLLLALIGYSAVRMHGHIADVRSLLLVKKNIDEFSAASDNLAMLGADRQLLEAYRALVRKIQDSLRDLGTEYPGALEAARRIDHIAQLVTSELHVHDTYEFPPADSALPTDPLDVSVTDRIIMQQVSGHGIALDTALNSVLLERQQAIARKAVWLASVLVGSTLLFGIMCVAAFGLLHSRVARPVVAITETLKQVRSGDMQARVSISGNDELSRLAKSLNQALDERDKADARAKQREERLQSVLAKLQSTQGALVRAQAVAQIGSWEVDFATGRLNWSDQLLRLYGIERESFSGREEDFIERIYPEDLERILKQRQQCLEAGSIFDASYRIVKPDGEIHWLREQALVMSDREGQPAFTVGTVQDITRKLETEERLLQFQELLEGSEDLCAIVDESYRYIWVNKSYASYHQLSLDRIPDLSVKEVVGETYFEEVVRPGFDQCLMGEVARFETLREIPGSETRDMLVRYYPIDSPGHTTIAVVITDITDVRKAQAEILRQGRLYDMAGQAARLGAWSANLKSNRVEWSDVVAEIHAKPHGYSPTVEEGLDFYAPECRDRILKAYTACVERGETYDEELSIIDANGSHRWVRAVGEAVRDDRGAITGVQGAFQDITPQKELESETNRLANRLASMLRAITDVFVAFDHQWRFTYVNEKASAIIGKSSDELLGTELWTQFPDLVGTQTELALKLSMNERQPHSAGEYLEPLNGWFDIRAYPWEEGVAVFFRDITETHRMLARLKEQEDNLRAFAKELNVSLKTRQALINSLPAHVAMLNENGVIVDVNNQWRQFGEQNAYSGSSFGIGTNYVSLCETVSGDGADEAGEVALGLRDVLNGKRFDFALEYPCHSPSEERWFRAMFRALSAEQSDVRGAVAMHIDITERKRAERDISRLAYEDSLTGALSRVGFTEILDEMFKRSGWPNGGIVAMIDVINQHDINDAYGYEMGDRLLVALNLRLLESLADETLTARTGGDEFVVYLPGSDKSDPKELSEELERAVGEPFYLGNDDLRNDDIGIEIGVHLGYTALVGDPRSAKDLMREAELALFDHRTNISAGATPTAYTKEFNKQTRERIQLTRDLKQALKEDEFELFFQPKVNLGDGSMVSAEALIRWRHPERGLIPPGLFIPVAEQSQLIGPIGDWVLREACRQLSQWQASDLNIVRVAVNVSQIQFQLGSFSGKVKAALEEFNVDPGKLTLEITESVFESQADRLLAEIKKLHEIGVCLSLDDFGTGYSSLLYIQRYPFDEIKIDAGFVRNLLDDRYSQDVVHSVLNLARALNAEVVAEGIETKAIGEALFEMGCKVGQGFYYSIPLEKEDFRWLLEQRSALPLAR